MKTFIRFFFFLCVILPSTSIVAQITNLLVNGSSTHFTAISGGDIGWSFNLPVGGTAQLEIWIDVNANGTVESVTDVLWQSFYQIDGQQGYNGPPDLDGAVNGQITFGMPLGLAPAEYIMSFSNNNSAILISGTITPLMSPVFIISGTVSVPPGKSAQNLIMNLENESDNGGKFWTAITDLSGNYSIFMDSDTSGNPWKLRIDNEQRLSPAILSPDRIELTLDAGVSTNYFGNNFTFNTAAAEVKGVVRGDDGNPISGIDVFISSYEQGWDRNTITYIDGTYSLGILSTELPANSVWIGSGSSEDNSIVSAGMQLPTIYSGNVITKNLFVYNANSTISGRATLNGNSPNMNLEIMGSIPEAVFVRTWTDYNGYFTLNVTDKLYGYNITAGYLPANYMGNSIIANAGQTNVILNFNLTDIEENHSSVPTEFALSQNYPNPFNPNTTISWQSPVGSWQTLKVFDVLGKEVVTLVNEWKEAGYHSINFEAGNLPSDIYFYQLITGSFVETKKMSLLR
jgi:hypothetical protein